jgi:hypothetical protein
MADKVLDVMWRFFHDARFTAATAVGSQSRKGEHRRSGTNSVTPI